MCHLVNGPVSAEVVATVPYEVLLHMTQHPLADIGVTRFIEDRRRVSRVR